MSTTYVWKIAQVGTRDSDNFEDVTLTDAIVKVVWKKTGTDLNGFSATYVGETELDPTSTSASSFINYSDVTSSDIIDWLEATISTEEMAKIDAVIAKKIEQQKITIRDFNN